MLKNIVFDMGNVLIEYTPLEFIKRAGVLDAQDQALLMKNIFKSPLWPKIDSGEFTEEMLYAAVRPSLPCRLHPLARQMIFGWNELARPIPGMAEVVARCKERGFKVYLLSNASCRQKEYWQTIPGWQHFDGTMVSAFEGVIKPNPVIFEKLLSRFQLKAQECLFVDDMPRNVAAAVRAGLYGFLFTGNAHSLEKAIDSLTMQG